MQLNTLNIKIDAIIEGMSKLKDQLTGLVEKFEKVTKRSDEQINLVSGMGKVSDENKKIKAENNKLQINLLTREERGLENQAASSDTSFTKMLQPLELPEHVTKFSALKIPIKMGILLLKVQLEYPQKPGYSLKPG